MSKNTNKYSASILVLKPSFFQSNEVIRQDVHDFLSEFNSNYAACLVQWHYVTRTDF